MWLHMNRKLRRMEDGRQDFEEVLYDKIDPKVRVYGYLLNAREYCGLQKIAWATFPPETPGLITALEELEAEGKVSRKLDDILADHHGGLWKANF